jgi:hypothetical protein
MAGETSQKSCGQRDVSADDCNAGRPNPALIAKAGGERKRRLAPEVSERACIGFTNSRVVLRCGHGPQGFIPF